MVEDPQPHRQPRPQPEPPARGPQGPADVDAVTHAVLTASRLLVKVSARSLAAVAERVTLPQFRLLAVLAAHGDAKLVDIAERLGVNPSTAMRMLDRLIVAGLATRQSNPCNRRETLLRLTPEGRTLVDRVTAVRHREISAIVERLTPEQRTALVGALTAFTEAGGEPGVPGEDTEPYPLGWSDTTVRHSGG
ncbi:MarR family transcriptional regulator [Streptomyces scopuliridis]|uniref:MarR family transcriptional regulator n=1 Tax=Streptomyces scopuliridis TaxID=452529 RepID=A0ACD4ZQ69_9ACTN|nr:MarR family transcriptional regulator [Streptomyces scopuliridis]WSC00438.1 MarR family transcriptional regulator [Streptomyces scopuliridis]WSC05950.1 MarR family transcriptional regulator [Streptomyces scopuliridis]